MKIAVSVNGTDLDAELDPRFGRCRNFIIVDPETMQYEVIENSSNDAAGGAGISAAQSLVDKGIEAVLTGNCGPNAHEVLSAAGIKVITGVSGTVRNAIEAYKLGTYTAATQPSVPGHFGSGGGPGMGRGGGSRGMGRGGGRSMGRRIGR